MNNMDNTYEPTEDKTQEKIKVESIDTIVTMHGDKPYYENKYREVGDKCYHIGYSSYYLDVALEYRKKYFEVVERESDLIPCNERMPKGYNTKTCNGCISYCKEKNIMRPCEYGICIWEYEKQSEEIGDTFRIIAKRIRNSEEVDLEITNKSKHISKIELEEGEINYD